MDKPTFKEALKFWIKLGFISFGGPAGQISIMHQYLVTKKKWISDRKFLHALNYCMLLPGPEAQQLATYIGWLLHGTRGGLAAGILFVLPSVFILLGLSMLYVSFGNIPAIYALFNGLKPAVVAIVILALIRIGKKSLMSPFHYLLSFIAFICLFFFNVSFPFIILGAILIAAVSHSFIPGLFKTIDKASGQKEDNESEYYLNQHTIVAHAGFNLNKVAKQIGIAVLLWLTPVIAFYFFTADFDFWKRLVLFFTQAALVTFGGAYSVLPYVAQVSVEKFHWLSNLEMIDGLALGETTPGPLIMVLAFVGFMAGHHQYGSSLPMGALGMITTTFYTFLPCFLFILAGAPIIERTRENKIVKEILSLVTSAVVGVMLNLTLYVAMAVLFPKELSVSGLDYVQAGWTLLSFIVLNRFKSFMIPWIGISAVFGLFNYLITS